MIRLIFVVIISSLLSSHSVKTSVDNFKKLKILKDDIITVSNQINIIVKEIEQTKHEKELLAKTTETTSVFNDLLNDLENNISGYSRKEFFIVEDFFEDTVEELIVPKIFGVINNSIIIEGNEDNTGGLLDDMSHKRILRKYPGQRISGPWVFSKTINNRVIFKNMVTDETREVPITYIEKIRQSKTDDDAKQE